ncbi:HAD-IA family hydrolase [Parasphingorhabdus cellanae]|uniref:phosphoglycolate phosphatase n=1 Tax=Parasphingorhabdus cellanae TaxID=2806553 RepID=A0ABX7T6J7_9SPHN|nr:HAD-IA family hydrolase [Parasphingorhabdus cellanae]QTD56538.1 HAD-IA family hydrolase [Parasphingorhabdus cellanae]
MTEISFDIIGFDLDGTLLDTSMELAASLNHALDSAGRPQVDEQSIRSLVGMGARHMLEMALEQSGGSDKDLVKSLMPVLIDHYEANLGQNAPAFAGLVEAMDALQDQGIKLAVVTNKFESLAVKLLTTVGMIDRFVTVIGGDTMGKGRSKPKRDPIDEMIRRCGGMVDQTPAAFIGDSIFDIKAAQNAGIANVAVSFGFLYQPVEELGADAIIDHYDELVPTLVKLGS